MESFRSIHAGNHPTGPEDTSASPVSEVEVSDSVKFFAPVLCTGWAKNPANVLGLLETTAHIDLGASDNHAVVLELEAPRDTRGRERRMRLQIPSELLDAIAAARR